jgi:signal transduction histidine kinase
MLGVITGSAELALMDLHPSHTVYDHLDQIRKAASRSAGITRQLLAFSKKQASQPKVVDLNSAVQSFSNILKHMTGENVQLKIEGTNGSANILIDPYQLDQILSNLCINARDAIKDNGLIKIEINETILDQDSITTDYVIESGSYIVLKISDNGSGMTKDVLDKIFEPFFTTKEAGKGTGLGLPTVYGIVKQNNGYFG